MTQQTAEKLNRKISDLKKEVKTLRSFIIGNIAKDKEGEYKPEFIKKVLGSSKEKARFCFNGKEDFLEQIKKTR
jgi:hypothetical protein